LRILAVGGAGYIGSISVEAFVKAGHDVVAYDDLSTGHAAAVIKPTRLVRGSIQDRARLEALLRDERIDAVLHCAAKSLVGESMIDPALYYRHNVTGGVAMLEAMRTAGVTRLVYSSTAAVYGEPRRVPIAEADRTEPINPYGATKLAFEGAMRWFAASHDLRAISLRYFNVAGATQRNGEDHHPETHLVPLVLRVAAGEASHVQIYGQDYPTPDGTCIRDYVHVRDLAAAHLLALEATGEGDPSLEVYNLGSAAGFSVREVVEAARKVTGRSIPARVLKRRSGDPPVLVASSRRARRELGWHPQHSGLDEMLSDAWAWRLAHPDGYTRAAAVAGSAPAALPSARFGVGQNGGDGVDPIDDHAGAGVTGGSSTSPLPSLG
jgi:UDP-glucose 4-epimerase